MNDQAEAVDSDPVDAGMRELDQAHKKWLDDMSKTTCEKAARAAADAGEILVLSIDKAGNFQAVRALSVGRIVEFVPEYLRRR